MGQPPLRAQDQRERQHGQQTHPDPLNRDEQAAQRPAQAPGTHRTERFPCLDLQVSSSSMASLGSVVTTVFLDRLRDRGQRTRTGRCLYASEAVDLPHAP